MQELLDPDRPGKNGVVLYGIGGSGKTQLTLRFIMENHHKYSAVLWINVSTIEQTKQSFSEMADTIAVRWPTRDVPSVYIGPVDSHKVVSRLRSTRYSRWLLVVDGVDDLSLENYTTYIPSCKHGSVIITSTQAQAVDVFQMDPIHVDSLDVSSASKLLLSKSASGIAPTEASPKGNLALKCWLCLY